MEKLVAWLPKSKDSSVASVRFRCLTPLKELQRTGFPAELYSPERDNAGAYSAVVFSKLYGPKDQELALSLTQRGIKTVLDVSDNHFYNPFELQEYRHAGENLRRMAQLVDRVIACSPHLAGIIAKEASLAQPALVVGDAVEELVPLLDARSPFEQKIKEPFRIVWFGSHGSPNAPAGMQDLLLIAPHLERAHVTRSCELVVISNSREKYEELAPKIRLQSRYREWSDTVLMEEFAGANLVVVPVTANPFTKCKSNNRVATALWYGIAVIADRIPAYEGLSAFCFLDEWETGFSNALAMSHECRMRTAAGSAYVRAHFNTRAIGAEWRRALKIILAQHPRAAAE